MEPHHTRADDAGQPPLRVLLCLFGIIPRSLQRTWPRFAEQREHLAAHGITSDVFAFNLMPEPGVIVDGRPLNQDDVKLLDRIVAQPPAGTLKVRSSPQARADAAIDARCGGAGAPLCQIRNPWYNEGVQRNALREMFSEAQVATQLLASSLEYDVAIAIGPDYYLGVNISVADVRAAARPESARAVYTSNLNDGNNNTGCTDGFFIGQPRALAALLGRFRELPGPALDSSLRIDDYESVLLRTFARHSIERRLTPMAFFKIRATGRVTWQTPSMAVGMIRPSARALLSAPRAAADGAADGAADHGAATGTSPSALRWPWMWCSVPEWLAKHTPRGVSSRGAGRFLEAKREAVRSLHALIDHDRPPCRVRNDDDYVLRRLEAAGGWRNLSACANLRGAARVDYGVCGWARTSDRVITGERASQPAADVARTRTTRVLTQVLAEAAGKPKAKASGVVPLWLRRKQELSTRVLADWTTPRVANTPEEVGAAPLVSERKGGRSIAAECSAHVQPIDAPPVRSPVRAHHYLASLFDGKHVAEVGTRNGDGMACFSRYAAHAVAIEVDSLYCKKLEQRAAEQRAAGGRGYDVVCGMFSGNASGTVEAAMRQVEYVHWWIGGFANVDLLTAVHALHQRGVLRPSAQAVVLFDLRHGTDVLSWRLLERYAKWSRTFDFDECGACRQLYTPSHREVRASKYFVTCGRAIGTFRVAAFVASELGPLVAQSGRMRLVATPDNFNTSSCAA